MILADQKAVNCRQGQLSGHRIINMCKEIKSYIWSHRSSNNIIFALHARMFGHSTYPGQ